MSKRVREVVRTAPVTTIGLGDFCLYDGSNILVETLQYESPFILITVNKAWNRFFATMDNEEPWDTRLKRWKLASIVNRETELAYRNYMDFDKHIHMNEALHQYVIVFWLKETRSFNVIYSRSKDHPNPVGGLMSGTTYIGKVLFEEFIEDVVITRMMASRNWSKSKYFGMTREEIKVYWKSNANKGTYMHKQIENYYNGLPYDAHSKEMDLFFEYEGERLTNEDLIPYRNELMIYDLKLRWCGSVDMIYIPRDPAKQFDKDGKRIVFLYDWKRTEKIDTSNRWQKGISPITKDVEDCKYKHYWYQLVLYEVIVTRVFNWVVHGKMLVKLHPDQDKPILMPVECTPLDKARLIRQRRKELTSLPPPPLAINS